MIIFSAIIPHSPLLIPEIGKDNLEKLAGTTNALKNISGHFYASFPETVVIISPHGDVNKNSFILNFAPKFQGNFSEFGHVNEKPQYYGDNELSYKIKSRLKTNFPMQLTTIESLDYGVLVPLHYLSERNQDIKILPISPASSLSAAENFAFGQAVNDELLTSSKRIAVIASIETSNKLSKISPAGYEAGSKKFDTVMIDLITKQKNKELLKINPEKLIKFGWEELNALALFLGIMSEKKHTPQLLSYENPFGVGHLVMEFEM